MNKKNKKKKEMKISVYGSIVLRKEIHKNSHIRFET